MKTTIILFGILISFQLVLISHKVNSLQKKQDVTYQLTENLYSEIGDHPELYFLNHPEEVARMEYTNGIVRKNLNFGK